MNKKRGRELLKELKIQKNTRMSQSEVNVIVKDQNNEVEEQKVSKDSEKDKILKNFQCLDSIINQLSNRKQSATIDSVLENVSKMMIGSQFFQEDLITILTISPQAYFLNQSSQPGNDEIIISINNYWPSNNNNNFQQLNRYHVPIETRINEFRNLLNSTDLNLLKNNLPSDLHFFFPNQLSDIVNNQTEDNLTLSEFNQKRKLKTSSSSLREVVDMVATLQNLESEGNINQPALTPSLSSQSSSSQSSSINHIDSLRQEITQKSVLQKERAKLEQQAQTQICQLSATVLLPFVVDTLRTLSRSKNKTIFSFDEIVRVLTTSLRLLEGDSQVTGVKVINRLAQEASEFVTIFPADEMISYPTIRINLSASLIEVRKRMKELSESAIVERDRIRNSIQSIGFNSLSSSSSFSLSTK